MLKYGQIAGFSPVIKVSWKMEKNRGFGDPKVAETGNIGKKLQWQAKSIMKDTSPCRIKHDDA